MKSLKEIMIEYLGKQIKFVLSKEKDYTENEERWLDWALNNYFNLKYGKK